MDNQKYSHETFLLYLDKIFKLKVHLVNSSISLFKKFTHFVILIIPYNSGSQPGCREEVLGVPSNIEFTTFLFFLLLRIPRIVIFAR